MRLVPHISQLPKLVNYAAYDCGAQVRLHRPLRSGPTPTQPALSFTSRNACAQIVSTSSAVKSATALLKASKDDYFMAPCESEIFVVLELCDQILVQEVRLANFELFSSMVKTVTLSIAER